MSLIFGAASVNSPYVGTCTSHVKLEPHLTLQRAGDVVASCACLDRHWSPPMWGIDIPRSLWHCYASWAIYMDPNGMIVR
jgi:hypothetical protein